MLKINIERRESALDPKRVQIEVERFSFRGLPPAKKRSPGKLRDTSRGAAQHRMSREGRGSMGALGSCYTDVPYLSSCQSRRDVVCLGTNFSLITHPPRNRAPTRANFGFGGELR
jgi:hypothetical protein